MRNSESSVNRQQAYARTTDRHIAVSDNGLAEVNQVVNAAKNAHACSITWSRADHGKGLIFYLSGSYQNVMAARGYILRECPVQVCMLVVLVCRLKMDRRHALLSG